MASQHEMDFRREIGRAVETVATEPEVWTVQCAGLPGAYCGLVTVGPLAGQRLPWIDGASSTYCADCYAVVLEQVRARQDRNKAS